MMSYAIAAVRRVHDALASLPPANEDDPRAVPWYGTVVQSFEGLRFVVDLNSWLSLSEVCTAYQQLRRGPYRPRALMSRNGEREFRFLYGQPNEEWEPYGVLPIKGELLHVYYWR